MQCHPAAGDACHIEEIVYEMREMTRLPFNHLARAAHRRRVCAALEST